jgi:hypothetical protein
LARPAALASSCPPHFCRLRAGSRSFGYPIVEMLRRAMSRRAT